MPSMNVSLPAELAQFVQTEVSSGDYSTASEVVREGLRLLRRQRELHEERIAVLRREIALEVADVEAGRLADKTPTEIAAEIEAEFLRKR